MSRISIFPSDMTMVSYFNIMINIIIVADPTFSTVIKIVIVFFSYHKLKHFFITSLQYFSFRIFEFNIFTFFSHYNSLFAINFKLILIFLNVDWMFFFIFIAKNNNVNRILYFNFANVSNFNWKYSCL